MNDGSLAIDLNAPAGGATIINGIAQNASGAIHGKTAAVGSDVFVAGVRVSAAGAVVYGTTVPVQFTSGNGTVAANDKVAFTT